MEKFTWTQVGETAGEPAWYGVCGDYEARVNKMHRGDHWVGAGLWNWRVNNSGKMGCRTVEEAKAAAEQALNTRLAIRVAEAKATIAAFPGHFASQSNGGGDA